MSNSDCCICPFCGGEFLQTVFKQHTYDCELRYIKSQEGKPPKFLDKFLNKKGMDQTREKVGPDIKQNEQSITCQICKKLVDKKYVTEHEKSHKETDLESALKESEKLAQSRVQCPVCMQWFRAEEMDVHIDKCLENQNETSKNSEGHIIEQKSMTSPRSITLSYNKTQDSRQECPFCFNLFQISIFQKHVKDCAKNNEIIEAEEKKNLQLKQTTNRNFFETKLDEEKPLEFKKKVHFGPDSTSTEVKNILYFGQEDPQNHPQNHPQNQLDNTKLQQPEPLLDKSFRPILRNTVQSQHLGPLNSQNISVNSQKNTIKTEHTTKSQGVKSRYIDQFDNKDQQTSWKENESILLKKSEEKKDVPTSSPILQSDNNIGASGISKT